METIFSKIINGDIGAHKIYDDAHYIAILDINPKNKGHFLVIPKHYSKNLITIKAGEIEPLFKISIKLANQVINALGATSYQLHVNNGADADQQVMHTHVHIVPYYKNNEQQVLTDFDQIKTTIVKYLSN